MSFRVVVISIIGVYAYLIEKSILKPLSSSLLGGLVYLKPPTLHLFRGTSDQKASSLHLLASALHVKGSALNLFA